MAGLADKRALVVDHGLYPHVAVKLAETFKTVMYWVDWTHSGFPSSKRRQIGEGLPNVHKVYSLWQAVREADLVVFCDVYFHDEVAQCRLMDKPVWAAGDAEALEVERWKTKQLMEDIGMDVIPYELLIGVDAVYDFLKDKEDFWIKGSVTRGDFETFHWEREHVSGSKLKALTRQLGPRRHTMEFIVEPSVKALEFGADLPCIDGRFGNIAMWGAEDKDASYWAKVCPFAQLPQAIAMPTLQLAPTMGKLGCRGFYSNEIRVTDEEMTVMLGDKEYQIPRETAFLIDPTMRCGSPPSESYIELFDNWAEVIWAGAHGEVVDLEPIAQYAAQIVLKSDWVTEDEYLPVYVPEELRRWVKLHNYCIYDGDLTVTPQAFPEFGMAIGLGDTKEEARDAALEVAERVEATDLDWKRDSFTELEKRFKEGEAIGIDF